MQTPSYQSKKNNQLTVQKNHDYMEKIFQFSLIVSMGILRDDS